MKKLFILISLVTLIVGCAPGLTNRQKMALRTYESRGLAINEKSPGAAAFLGILPGFGSFYGEEYALGVVNLMFWPLSMCWDPVSGYRAATRINYVETKEHVNRLKEKETLALNQKRMANLLDDYTYNMELYRISQKYDLDPISQPLVYVPVNYSGSRNTLRGGDQAQQIQLLQQENLSYDEYQRRYKQIMDE